MTPELAALAAVISRLVDIGIPYMVTGSVAASAHGRPRSTHDADIVIDPTPPQLDRLLAELRDEGFYIPADVARTALTHRGQFSVIETTHACKIDLIVRKATHRRGVTPSRFHERRSEDVRGRATGQLG